MIRNITITALIVSAFTVPALSGSTCPSVETLAGQLPANVNVALMIQDFDALAQEIRDGLVAEENPELAFFEGGLAEVIDGPIVIGVSNLMTFPLNGRIAVLFCDAQPAGLEGRIQEQIAKPLQDIQGAQEEAISTRTEDDVLIVTIRSTPTTTLYGVHQEGTWYFDTDKQTALDFSKKTEKPSRLADSPDFSALLKHNNSQPQVAVYCNLKTMIRFGLGMLDQEYGKPLSKPLGLDRVGAFLATLDWKSGQIEGKLSIRLDDGPEGLPGFLTASEGSAEILSIVPDTFLGVHYLALDNGAKAFDRLGGLIDVLDPDIMNEVDQDRTVFKETYGVDLKDDLLANFQGGVLMGLKAHDAGNPEVFWAVRLAEPDAFQKQFDQLSKGMDLTVVKEEYHDAEILRTPDDAEHPVALAVVDSCLVVSAYPSTIQEIIDGCTTKRTFAQSQRILGVRNVLPETMSMGWFIDASVYRREEKTDKAKGSLNDLYNPSLSKQLASTLRSLSSSYDLTYGIAIQGYSEGIDCFLCIQGSQAISLSDFVKVLAGNL